MLYRMSSQHQSRVVCLFLFTVVGLSLQQCSIDDINNNDYLLNCGKIINSSNHNAEYQCLSVEEKSSLVMVTLLYSCVSDFASIYEVRLLCNNSVSNWEIVGNISRVTRSNATMNRCILDYDANVSYNDPQKGKCCLATVCSSYICASQLANQNYQPVYQR